MKTHFIHFRHENFPFDKHLQFQFNFLSQFYLFNLQANILYQDLFGSASNIEIRFLFQPQTEPSWSSSSNPKHFRKLCLPLPALISPGNVLIRWHGDQCCSNVRTRQLAHTPHSSHLDLSPLNPLHSLPRLECSLLGIIKSARTLGTCRRLRSKFEILGDT